MSPRKNTLSSARPLQENLRFPTTIPQQRPTSLEDQKPSRRPPREIPNKSGDVTLSLRALCTAHGRREGVTRHRASFLAELCLPLARWQNSTPARTGTHPRSPLRWCCDSWKIRLPHDGIELSGPTVEPLINNRRRPRPGFCLNRGGRPGPARRRIAQYDQPPPIIPW